MTQTVWQVVSQTRRRHRKDVSLINQIADYPEHMGRQCVVPMAVQFIYDLIRYTSHMVELTLYVRCTGKIGYVVTACAHLT